MIGQVSVNQLNFSRSGTANHFASRSLAIWPCPRVANRFDECLHRIASILPVIQKNILILSYSQGALLDLLTIALPLWIDHSLSPLMKSLGQYLLYSYISILSITQLNTVTKVILSGYCIDEEWVFGKLRSVRKVMAVTHWDRTHEKSGKSIHPHW